MDLRIQRTRNNIINAFIELRSKKPIEKITVKELSDLAIINKATFYLHYKDIYDLSDSIEDELIDDCLKSMYNPYDMFTIDGFRNMTYNFYSQGKLFDTIFSGSRMDVLVNKLEKKCKEKIFQVHPEYRDNLKANVLLSSTIFGCFHSFFEYRDKDIEVVINCLAQISEDCLKNLNEDL